MADYLSAELYKVVHRKYTWIALGLFLGCVVLLTALWWATNSHGGFVPLSGALYTLVMLLSVGLYAPLITTDLVFSEQYKIGTLKNEISYGIPRSRIYLGKLVLEIAVAVLACALAVGLYLALCVPTLPLEADPDGMLMAETGRMWEMVGRCLLSAFPLWLGAQGVTHLCFFLFRGGVAAPFAAVGVVAGIPGLLKLLGLLLNPLFLTALRRFTLVAPMDNWDYPIWECWLIGLGWLAASTLLGLLLFQRREIN